MKPFNFVGFVKNLNWNAKILVVAGFGVFLFFQPLSMPLKAQSSTYNGVSFRHETTSGAKKIMNLIDLIYDFYDITTLPVERNLGPLTSVEKIRLAELIDANVFQAPELDFLNQLEITKKDFENSISKLESWSFKALDPKTNRVRHRTLGYLRAGVRDTQNLQRAILEQGLMRLALRKKLKSALDKVDAGAIDFTANTFDLDCETACALIHHIFEEVGLDRLPIAQTGTVEGSNQPSSSQISAKFVEPSPSKKLR